ncbi:hypothetical protein [Nocardia carnea]|uniref:hypothetical protein n=1 Tax=Nocardia carnea TaxID=37328 RepID=UPI002454B41A|nr:hypothetical protein [Nocardia carnea]
MIDDLGMPLTDALGAPWLQIVRAVSPGIDQLASRRSASQDGLPGSVVYTVFRFSGSFLAVTRREQHH